jgi:hypothetical protein
MTSPGPSTIAPTHLANVDPSTNPPGDDQGREEQHEGESDSESELEAEQAEGIQGDLFNERRVIYEAGAGRQLSERGCKRKDGNELEPAMDDMINAGSGDHRLKCFHHPPMLYFGNDKTGECCAILLVL